MPLFLLFQTRQCDATFPYLAIVSGHIVGGGGGGDSDGGTRRRRARRRLHVLLVAHRFVFYRHRVLLDADHLDVACTVAPNLVERQFARAVLTAILLVQI